MRTYKHDISEETLIAKECSETFETIYEKEYFPREVMNEIKKADFLLIPDYVKREYKRKVILA